MITAMSLQQINSYYFFADKVQLSQATMKIESLLSSNSQNYVLFLYESPNLFGSSGPDKLKYLAAKFFDRLIIKPSSDYYRINEAGIWPKYLVQLFGYHPDWDETVRHFIEEFAPYTAGPDFHIIGSKDFIERTENIIYGQLHHVIAPSDPPYADSALSN